MGTIVAPRRIFAMKRMLFLVVTCLGAGILRAAPAPEPEVRQQTLEDDNVRIEELRVRGQTQRIVVKPKVADVRPYEIIPADPGEPRRAGAGQRVWQLLRF